jgi:DNA-binding transcriptional LysR family regulator
MEYFVTVAEYLNFTKAANSLYIAQSALSQQILDMETKMGISLFTRTKRSVVLTAAGAVFYLEVKELLKQYHAAMEKVYQVARGVTGTLHIGVAGATLRLFMPQIIRRFQEEYPSINLKFFEYYHGDLLPMLESGEVDVIFPMNMGPDGSLKNIEIEVIYKDENALAMPIEHPLAGEDEVELPKAAQEKFIFLDRNISPLGYYAKIRMCENNGFSPQIVCVVKNIDTILWLIESGIGISILPYCSRHISFPAVRFAKIKNESSIFTMSIAYLRGNDNPAVQLLLNLIRLERDSIRFNSVYPF